ncbi:MAG: DUF1634 domain-containing protein [Methanomethylophilus sp.]|jgi:uncharacterized membrane protein
MDNERLNAQTSFVLKWGSVLGIIIMAVGIVVSMFADADAILYTGILVLILTPPVALAVSAKCLWQDGDRKWFGVAMVLIAVIVISMIVTKIL